MVLTACHMVVASRFFLPLPHIAIFISGLHTVLAAWVAFYYPSENPIYDIGGRIDVYLDYAGPVLCAFIGGWIIAMSRLNPTTREAPNAPQNIPALRLELDIMIWGGLGFAILGRMFDFQSFQFAVLLAADLRFVGVIGWMLLAEKGWLWRTAFILLFEVSGATSSGMFHSLILWSLALLAVYLYRFRPKITTVVTVLTGCLLLLPALQEAKWRLREEMRHGQVSQEGALTSSLAKLERPIVWTGYVLESLWKLVTLTLDPNFVADTAVRYNQGWIINRIMWIVPKSEPYAKGETIETALISAFLPRVFAPSKHTAGGAEYMERFAGYRPAEGTSMNLGYAGEMFANFGYTGGIVAGLLYSLFLGLLFRIVYIKTRNTNLWWMFVPYVGHYALKAETGLAETVNWLFKALVVSLAVAYLFPALRSALKNERTAKSSDAPYMPATRKDDTVG